MDVVSLGFRTDLALLRLGGTRIEDRGDHRVIRTPHNPTFWWGNFLLLRAAPADDAEVDGWFARFAAEFPAARHVAFGIDGTDGSGDDLAGFARRGLDVDVSRVMTAKQVHEARHPNRDAVYRALADDDEDWAQSLRLARRCNDVDEDPASYESFIRARTDTTRRLVKAGHGGWFGAFLDGRLVAQMGLFAAGPGLARFQSVETDPNFRRQGLAAGLVHHVSRYGLDELGATTLVMVADPHYVAIRLYRAVGFDDTECQLQVQRGSAGDAAAAGSGRGAV